MLPLQGKKILYIGVSTFNYEKEIKAGLERLGAEVDYFDERPANDFLTKVFLRLKLKKLIQSKIDTHYSNIFKKIKKINYDYVFIIKLETINKRIITKLKESQKDATFILYLWDSIQNYKGKEKLLPFFDKAFSFDKTDVEKYAAFSFLPLFYIPPYAKQSKISNAIEYDLCFIGTGHSDRYKIVKKIEALSSKKGLSFYKFMYLQSPLIFWVKKLFDRSMKNAHITDFSFSSLNQDELLKIINKSKVVVDIEHKGQVGLTMRTIEMLGSEKKLLTTNQSIKEYDFYNEQNIFIVDRENPVLDINFFKSPYIGLDRNIYERYSLQNWLISIFTTDN